MAEDAFTERLNKIRTRFATNLAGRFDAIDKALPQLSGEGETVIATLATVHRSAHELCGIAPTVGFAETGKAARIVERILLQPLRDKRGLNDSEIANVRQELAALRAAAKSELQSVCPGTAQ